jgi:hypothetical protein
MTREVASRCIGGGSWQSAREGVKKYINDAKPTTHRLYLSFFIAFLRGKYQVANRNEEG